MPTFLLTRFTRRDLHVEQNQALARVLLEVDAVLEQRRQSKLPGDPLSLRGIPAIGRGVGGAVRGSNPEAEACR